ncbi:PD40 domain-containing protein [bacterium]|nr:PD40 domain-containing protein [bacterium]
MGSDINTGYRDKRAFVSRDGKYLFFASDRIGKSELPEETMTLEELRQMMQLPVNGYENIYWVDAKIIEELKPEHLK